MDDLQARLKASRDARRFAEIRRQLRRRWLLSPRRRALKIRWNL